MVPARDQKGTRCVRFAQRRGCPRNCKRRASDHNATENARVLGKVVGGDDPRARRPATAEVTRGRSRRGVLMLPDRLHQPRSGKAPAAAVRGDELLPRVSSCPFCFGSDAIDRPASPETPGDVACACAADRSDRAVCSRDRHLRLRRARCTARPSGRRRDRRSARRRRRGRAARTCAAGAGPSMDRDRALGSHASAACTLR